MSDVVLDILIEKIEESKKEYIFYHKSNPMFRKSICKYGLIPQVGDSYKLYYEDDYKDGRELDARVFVSRFNDYNSNYDDDIYLIKLNSNEYKDLSFKEDKKVVNSFYTNKIISVKNIELIYKGSRESTF